MNNMLGVMIDCSRNAVMNVESVKRYASIIKKMGYNTLMLYTEDTYEVPNQPLFGHLRGRYSKDELKELDKYCLSIGIELIPCIQTLAHLNAMFKWTDEYSDINDCDDILIASDEKVLSLIDNMLNVVSECFTTKKVHIGMDEAFRIGTGKYQKIHGIRDRFDIINEHLHKVCEIASKYELEPMVWSDMFTTLALGTDNQYDVVEDKSALLEKAKLPENLTLVYWDYISKDPRHCEKIIKTNQLFERPVAYAAGAWTWRGFAPSNKNSIECTLRAIEACNNTGVKDMIITVWGDDGNECSPYSILPFLMTVAEIVNGNNDEKSVKDKFKEITGCSYDSFMIFDKMDELAGNHNTKQDYYYNPCKYLLYNDPFLGIRDYMCSSDDCLYYKNLSKEINAVSDKWEFGYLFDFYEKLARVLSVKSDLGVRTRKAYRENDTETLKIVVSDYDKTMELINDFHKAHQTRWFIDNKPHGFDVQDIRIGGLIQRLKSCKERLLKFISGEISNIPELDEPVLNDTNGSGFWWRVSTPNIIGHCLD